MNQMVHAQNKNIFDIEITLYMHMLHELRIAVVKVTMTLTLAVIDLFLMRYTWTSVKLHRVFLLSFSTSHQTKTEKTLPQSQRHPLTRNLYQGRQRMK